MTTIFRAGALLAAPGQAPLSGPCAIHVSDGIIVAIEPLAAGTLDADSAALVAMPAPANAHDHGRGLRSLAVGAADGALETWIPALQNEPLVDPYLRAATAFARMAEGGVCATNHCHNTQDGRQLLAEARGVARAAAEVGIRVAFGVPFAGRNAVVYGALDALLERLPAADHAALLATRRPSRTLEENMALVAQIAELENPWFEVQYCPVGPQWVDDATLRRVAAASAADGRRVHMHLFETRQQREWADARYRDEGGLLRYLEQIGLLSPRLTVAHCVWLTADDCALLAQHGVVVAVNSSSNLRLRSGVAPLADFLAHGLAFGIGMDGTSFDDDEDMLREIRLLWHLQRGGMGASALDAGQLFDAACLTGRRSVTASPGGRLAPGMAADFLLLDRRRISADCLDPEGAELLPLLLTRMTKQDIDQLVVAGRVVARRGASTLVERPALERALLAEARAASAAAPPDHARIARLQQAVEGFYACGCHLGADDA
jgi:cytosine/adenosine deaminase-related metal-dependent hydrolase